MHREQMVRRFGLAGVAIGLAGLLAGPFAGELGSMIAGYGSVILLCAAYLLAGLAIRDRVRRRVKAQRPVPVYSAQR